MNYTVKTEADDTYPERGTAYIYADGKLDFTFYYYDESEFKGTLQMYFSTIACGDPDPNNPDFQIPDYQI